MAQSPIPLTQLAAHQEGAVFELRGGKGFVSRLATLGFTPGAPLTMVQNFGSGALIVRVRDARIALGRGEAAKVIVLRRSSHAQDRN
jgi:ferrous iron transport protein A